MIALNIVDLKKFTSELFIHQMFDRFYLSQGEVTTFALFQVDGHLNQDYYENEEAAQARGRKLALWSEVKPFIFGLIKGKKLPQSFKFVFQLSKENTRWLLERHGISIPEANVGGLYLNIRYENKKLTCITGTAFNTFVMDKSLEHAWDETAVQFFKQHDIAAELDV